MRIVIALALVLTLVLPTWAAVFTDINGLAAQRAIERLAAKGVVRGEADGKFNPGKVITRIELVNYLVRVLGISGQGLKVPSFKDLSDIAESDRPAVAASVGLGTLTVTQAQVKKGAIVYTLSADKPSYAPEEMVTLTFTIENTGKEDVAFEYTNSQFHDFIIRSIDGTELARWSLGRAFLPVDKPVILAAGKSMTFQTRWRQLDQNDQPVTPGRYEIVAMHTTKADPVSLSLFYQKGLVVGYPDNTFRPKQVVTRAELAAFVVRVAGLDADALAKAKATIPVSDDNAILDWARGSVAVVVERKWIPLIEGAFKPGAGASRADAAVSVDALMVLLNRYDFIKGTLRTVINTRQPLVSVEDDKKAFRTFRVALASAIYRNDKPATLADLKPGDAVIFLMPSDAGDIVYLEAAGK